MQIKLNSNAEYIINKLNGAGFEAYAVGGCVRDSVMGRRCDDTDITTNALPEETKKVFSAHTIIETGIKHGTVTLVLQNTPYEITTYRQESEYTDSRHPDKVTFVRTLNEDLSRRDFTVNAIAFSPSEGVKDPFLGISDINKKLIRAVGDPKKRFSEDALRILRALRFASVLGFNIEENTSKAVIQLAETVNKVSGERIFAELKKLLCGINAQEVVTEYIDAIKKIIPVNGDYKKLSLLPCDFAMRLACLCGSDVSSALVRLRADNKTKHICNVLVNSSPLPNTEANLKFYISALGREDAQTVALYRRALYGEDVACQTEKLLSSKTPLFVTDLAINGNDIAKLGIKGKNIGISLNTLLARVMNGQIENNRETLLESARGIQ